MPEITTYYEKYDGIKTHPVFFKKDEIIQGQLNFNFPCFTTHPYSNNNFYDLSDEQLSDYEQAFKKAIEAMACGTPVIGTNQGGLPDIINEKVGSLIDVDDYNSLATNIVQFLKDKNTVNRDYIASYAKNNYSQDKLIDKLISIYEEAISK